LAFGVGPGIFTITTVRDTLFTWLASGALDASNIAFVATFYWSDDGEAEIEGDRTYAMATRFRLSAGTLFLRGWTGRRSSSDAGGRGM